MEKKRECQSNTVKKGEGEKDKCKLIYSGKDVKTIRLTPKRVKTIFVRKLSIYVSYGYSAKIIQGFIFPFTEV